MKRGRVGRRLSMNADGDVVSEAPAEAVVAPATSLGVAPEGPAGTGDGAVTAALVATMSAPTNSARLACLDAVVACW